MATVSNLFIDAGSTYSNIITVASTNGQPLNLTGFTVASQMRKSFQSSIAYSFNASIFDAVTGRIRLQLTDEQSQQIPPGRWLYDVEIESSAGVRTRVVEGIVTVTPQITLI